MSKKKQGKSGSVDDAAKVAEKKEAFIRVATPRVDKALKALDLVRLCAGSTYVYSDEQKRAILLALQDGMDKVKAAFEGDAKTASGFVMPSE